MIAKLISFTITILYIKYMDAFEFVCMDSEGPLSIGFIKLSYISMDFS